MSESLFPDLTREKVESVRDETALADRTRLRDAVRRAVNERIGAIVAEIIEADRETLIDPIVRDVLVTSKVRMTNCIEDTVRMALRDRVTQGVIRQAETVAQNLKIKIEVTQ